MVVVRMVKANAASLMSIFMEFVMDASKVAAGIEKKTFFGSCYWNW